MIIYRKNIATAPRLFTECTQHYGNSFENATDQQLSELLSGCCLELECRYQPPVAPSDTFEVLSFDKATTKDILTVAIGVAVALRLRDSTIAKSIPML